MRVVVAAFLACCVAVGVHAQQGPSQPPTGARGQGGGPAAGATTPVAAARAAPTPPVAVARSANTPPLVPVRLNVDGNFRIAPPYVADPAFTTKPDVPRGRVIRFTMNSAESKIFPTAPVGRGGRAAGARGEPAPQTPAEPPQ